MFLLKRKNIKISHNQEIYSKRKQKDIYFLVHAAAVLYPFLRKTAPVSLECRRSVWNESPEKKDPKKKKNNLISSTSIFSFVQAKN